MKFVPTQSRMIYTGRKLSRVSVAPFAPLPLLHSARICAVQKINRLATRFVISQVKAFSIERKLQEQHLFFLRSDRLLFPADHRVIQPANLLLLATSPRMKCTIPLAAPLLAEPLPAWVEFGLFAARLTEPWFVRVSPTLVYGM